MVIFCHNAPLWVSSWLCPGCLIATPLIYFHMTGLYTHMGRMSLKSHNFFYIKEKVRSLFEFSYDLRMANKTVRRSSQTYDLTAVNNADELIVQLVLSWI